MVQWDRDQSQWTKGEALCCAADCQGGDSSVGPSLSPAVHTFKGGYCLVPAATVLIV